MSTTHHSNYSLFRDCSVSPTVGRIKEPEKTAVGLVPSKIETGLQIAV